METAGVDGASEPRGYSLNGKRCCVRVCSLIDNVFHLTTGAWDSLKSAIFPLDQEVTKPGYLLIQPVVLLYLFTALRSGYLGQIGVEFFCALDSGHVAKAISATQRQQCYVVSYIPYITQINIPILTVVVSQTQASNLGAFT